MIRDLISVSYILLEPPLPPGYAAVIAMRTGDILRTMAPQCRATGAHSRLAEHREGVAGGVGHLRHV